MTAPADSFPQGASKEGVLNLVGNVWEWTADFYSPYEGEAPADIAGKYRVLRGGAWNSDPSHLTATYRLAYDPDLSDAERRDSDACARRIDRRRSAGVAAPAAADPTAAPGYAGDRAAAGAVFAGLARDGGRCWSPISPLGALSAGARRPLHRLRSVLPHGLDAFGDPTGLSRRAPGRGLHRRPGLDARQHRGEPIRPRAPRNGRAARRGVWAAISGIRTTSCCVRRLLCDRRGPAIRSNACPPAAAGRHSSLLPGSPPADPRSSPCRRPNSARSRATRSTPSRPASPCAATASTLSLFGGFPFVAGSGRIVSAGGRRRAVRAGRAERPQRPSRRRLRTPAATCSCSSTARSTRRAAGRLAVAGSFA
jgi:hypothetical protein